MIRTGLDGYACDHEGALHARSASARTARTIPPPFRMLLAMRILVTGAAGYIGSALAKALADRHEVLATDQSAPAAIVGNLAYPQFARSLVTPQVDAVFHLASLVSGGAEQNFELGTKVNLDATRDLLEACRLAGHRPKFVFASSIAVYGGHQDLVTDDT